jgi:hypothetical protein
LIKEKGRFIFIELNQIYFNNTLKKLISNLYLVIIGKWNLVMT